MPRAVFQYTRSTAFRRIVWCIFFTLESVFLLTGFFSELSNVLFELELGTIALR